MPGTILDDIVRTKRVEVAAAKKNRSRVEISAAIAAMPPPRDFYNAITKDPRPIRLIAEIKKSSPSAGLLRAEFNPAEIARIYEGSGAAALSVLTDRTYFHGDLSFIAAVRQAVALPILRKDFNIDEWQLDESRSAGADAVLLIAEILDNAQLESFSAHARDLGMASLIEVHDLDQLRRALPLVGRDRLALLGINSRDLRRQQTDLDTVRSLAAVLPSNTPFVAESGLKTRADVQSMSGLGATAVLIGETFMRAPDIAAKVRELMS